MKPMLQRTRREIRDWVAAACMMHSHYKRPEGIDLEQDSYPTEGECLLAVSRLLRSVPDCQAEPDALRCYTCKQWHPGIRGRSKSALKSPQRMR